MSVFVDTSALYALLDAGDDEHASAIAALGAIAEASTALTTHAYVVVETTALVQARLGMLQVRRLHEDILPAVTVEPVDTDVHRAGISALLAANRRTISLVDWVSFEFMRRRQIDTVFAFDEDFADQGFTRYGREKPDR